jgi:hypothetical protein
MRLGFSFKVNSVLFNKDSNSLKIRRSLQVEELSKAPTEVMLTLMENKKELVSPFGIMAIRNMQSIIMINYMESV